MNIAQQWIQAAQNAAVFGAWAQAAHAARKAATAYERRALRGEVGLWLAVTWCESCAAYAAAQLEAAPPPPCYIYPPREAEAAAE